MEAALGKPIRQAFEEDGEEAFRAREAEVVGELLERRRRRRDRPRRRQRPLRAGARRRWSATSSSCWRSTRPRPGGGSRAPPRPLATSEADVEALLAERLPLYEELADAVVPMADKGVVERALPAIQALAEMPDGDEAAVGVERFGGLPGVGRARSARHRLVAAGGAALLRHRQQRGARYAERLEPLGVASRVEPRRGVEDARAGRAGGAELAEAGMTREDHVVALGGGVVGDLAGFCAHVYQRGVPVVQVPTTLVAQVDSAYGGKTGVDVEELKNYAGAYHLPACGDRRHLNAGFAPPAGARGGFRRGAEDRACSPVGRSGSGCGRSSRSTPASSTTSFSPALATSARSSPPTSATPVCATSSTLATRSAMRSRRRRNYRYRHGEAIGLGLACGVAALGCSRAAGGGEDDPRTPRSTHRARPQRSQVDAVIGRIQRDKKRTAAGVGFVLLSEPGQAPHRADRR